MPRKSKRRTRRRTRRKRGSGYCSMRHGIGEGRALAYPKLIESITKFETTFKKVTIEGNTWKPDITNPALLEATKLLGNILRETHKCECRDYVRCYINDNIWQKKMGYNLTTKLIKAMINEDDGRAITDETILNIFMDVENIHIKDQHDQWRYLPFIKGDLVGLLPLTNEDQKHSIYRLTDSHSIDAEKARNFIAFRLKVEELEKETNPEVKVGGRWLGRSSGPTNKKGSRKKTKKKRTKNKTKKKRTKKRRRKRRR